VNRSAVLKVTAGMVGVVLPLAACVNTKPQKTVTVTVGAPAAAGGSSSSGANPANGSPASSVSAPPKPSKKYNVTFIQGVAGDQFYITMQCGAQAEASKLGVTLKTQGAQKFDPTLQTPIVDSVVQSKPDAIMIAPTDVTAMQKPLQVAAEAGIKVVLVDTTLKDPSIAVSAIASDNEGGGKAAFDAIKALAPQGGKVMIMSVDPGISTTDARAKGFQDAVKADPKYKYLGVQYDHDDPATASNLMSASLQKDPDIVGVFAANLFSAEGSATGITQAGKQNQVKIVGFDAGPNQIKDLKAGTVQALVAQQPGIIGQYGVDEAVASLEGAAVTPKVQTGFTVITQQNLNGAGAQAAYKSNC
jgi:ribose transport system substrate-binding protein